MTTDAFDRDFDAEVTINATPDRVWQLLSDPRTMPEASPELFALTRRRKGPFEAGETYIGWNRRGFIIWPTINNVVSVVPGRELSWHTKTSGAIWTYSVTSDGRSTVLREQRHMPDGMPRIARMFGGLLGGPAAHADELESHVSDTLQHLKNRAESER
ncbi:SRPBCC family protein [Gordonia sp. ABSL49_1]|uniref:SRPBCC family protein n=1 Tax=Gordonia sp. ABSL49_1 TaxID=2920941 RepID=UPI001F0FB6CB|nr:SRPBCC family protein [Gordonia sp. ABSL49_1]MCH5642563.1 SRPBCC family protein [Gordonia sp. ABSL49_1]